MQYFKISVQYFFLKLGLCWKVMTSRNSFIHIMLVPEKDTQYNSVRVIGYKISSEDTLACIQTVQKNMKEENERREFYSTFSQN